LTERTARLRSVSKAYTEQQEEMSAFRERMEAQGRLARARQEQDTVRAFFEPVQNLKRSVDAGVSDAESFLEGLRIVLHQFEAALTRLGLCAVPGIGTDFDPHLHEALAAMPVEDPEQDGKVLMVHRDGYMVGGRPVQVAQVVIGRHTPPAPPAEPEAAGEA
jgi:molecular chaperone GrpE